MKLTDEEIMKLADAYAFAAQGYNQKGLNEARAALEAALTVKQGEQEVKYADPFTYVIQHLNSNPYNMTKAECITHIKKLRDIYNGTQHMSDCAVHNEPAYPAGECACGAPAHEAKQEPDQRLLNLLCRIHRDGGHYIAEHGVDRAAADADVLLAELFAMKDAHPAPVNQQLLEALKQLVIATKHLNPCPGTLEMAEKAIKEAVGEV